MRKLTTRRVLEIGGVVAGAVLIAFGVVAIVMGVNGRSDVRAAISEQNITATPDAAEITNGKLEPGQPIKTGTEARAFADVMEYHALEATGGLRYSEMGRYLTPAGEPTDDEAQAATTPEGQPVQNEARNIWVTETALSTALNMSYMAEQLSVFGLVVGIALLLSGVGFVILALAGALRHARATESATAAVGATTAPLPS